MAPVVLVCANARTAGSFLSTALKLRGGCSRGSDVPGVGTGIVTLGGVCCMVHVVLV